MNEKLPFNRIRPHDDVRVEYLNDEVVLINLATGNYFGLDADQTRLWKVLIEADTVQEGVQELLEEGSMEEAELLADIRKLVDDLVEHRLVYVE